MDFLNMNFSTLFLNKHGQSIFESIRDKIVKEKSSSCNDEYIEIIFKIAFFEFWGLKNSEIDKMLKDIMRCKNLC